MDWVVGDLHGMLHTLQRLVERVAARDAAPRFVFVGDYADRGPFSRGLVDYLLALPYPAEFLRGNHDDVIDYLLSGQCCSELSELMIGRVTPGNVCGWWLENGFLTTMESYGVADSPATKSVYGYFDYSPVAEAFRAAVPETHKQFYRNLKVIWENETHFACHGFWPPNRKLPRSLTALSAAACTDVLWMRFQGSAAGGIESGVPVWEKTGVFGHTPVEVYGSEDVVRFPKMRLIDTGAWLGRKLTAYCCQTDGAVDQAVLGEDLINSGRAAGD